MTAHTYLLDLPSGGGGAGADVPMWIDGRAVESADGAGAVRDDVNPSTGSVLARVHQASAADVDRAVAAAARSQPAWAAMGVHERAARLAEWGRRVTEAAPRLGLLDARDSGTAVASMAASAAKGGKFLQTIAGVAPELHGRTIPATPGGLHFTEPAPWGVVAALCAYNHPTLFTCMKAAPALAAGNSVVLKPAEQTPLSPLVIASLATDLLPDGVFNVVPGGAAAGEALVTHHDVPRVSFTGSLRTGLAVQAAAGASGVLKSLTLELGGKNPILIFDDVDPDSAAAAVVEGLELRPRRRPELRRHQPAADPRGLAQGRAGAGGRVDRTDPHRHARRPVGRDGLHGLARPPRPDTRLRRRGPRRRRAAPDRRHRPRRSRTRPGSLRQARRVRRRGSRRHHRPHRDIRPGAGGYLLHRRGRGPSPWPTTPPTG